MTQSSFKKKACNSCQVLALLFCQLLPLIVYYISYLLIFRLLYISVHKFVSLHFLDGQGYVHSNLMSFAIFVVFCSALSVSKFTAFYYGRKSTFLKTEKQKEGFREYYLTCDTVRFLGKLRILQFVKTQVLAFTGIV